MLWPVARLGDTSSHGGVLITAGTQHLDAGPQVCRVGDLHSCPIPTHGVTAIVTGSPNFISQGRSVARGDGGGGSVTGCGAVLIGGSPKYVCD